MSKRILLIVSLVFQIYSCFGMFAPMGYAKTHSVQPQFTISYLSLKSSYFIIHENAFKHVQEIPLHACTRDMHYFEAKMRKLCINGSAYLQGIRNAIQSTIDKLGTRNTQRPVMDKHIQILDMLLSEPDIQRIDLYLEIKNLVQQGNYVDAFEKFNVYQSVYGECNSAHELLQLISENTYESDNSKITIDTRYLVSTNQDAKIGESVSRVSSYSKKYEWGFYHDEIHHASSSGMSDYRKKIDNVRRLLNEERARRRTNPQPKKVPAKDPSAPLQVTEDEKKQQEFQKQQALRRQHELQVKQEVERKQQLMKELEINTPSKIANALQLSESKQELFDNLNSVKDTVYANADKHTYEIHKDIKDQIQSSINGVHLCKTSHEFIFHVATTNHLLTTIQVGTAQKAGLTPTIPQYATELLGHGIEKYFEYVTMPTDKEVKFLVSMAQYISDIIVGTHYLTHEVKEARIAEFCDSLKSICTTNPKKIVDNCMYAAARATWWAGLPRAVKVIKEVSVVAGNCALKILQIFSNEFSQQFNQILQESPAMVTAEGVLVAATAQEVGLWQTISKAIWGPPENEINSVDKLMNFLESEEKSNAEIAKEFSSNKVAEILGINNSKPIKKINEGVINFRHIFSNKHKINGILLAGRKREIINKCLELIKKANDQRLLVEYDNEIRTMINNMPMTIRIHIKNGIMMNLNIFLNYSERILGKLIQGL